MLATEFAGARVGVMRDLLGDESPPAVVAGHFHHLGTTRMHHDPRRGATDAHGAVHGLSGLYVTGQSVFPTGGAANPTLTLIALAMRLADRVRTLLGDG